MSILDPGIRFFHLFGKNLAVYYVIIHGEFDTCKRDTLTTFQDGSCYKKCILTRHVCVLLPATNRYRGFEISDQKSGELEK